jgi:hypothetical protein
MSYIKTKLSLNDKEILKEIFEELEKIRLPSSFRIKGIGSYHSRKTGTTNQHNAYQVIFGKVKYRGKLQLSSYTKKYPYMMSLFKEFINSHYPNFKYNSIYVNKNTICKKHLDSKNTGESLLVGLGSYTGGQTLLYINDTPKCFHIKTNSIIFNGSEIFHESESFNGIRYSLVFFN